MSTTDTTKPNLSLVPDAPAPAKGPNRADRRKASADARKAENAAKGEPEAPAVQRRVYAVFVYDDAEGFERHDRMWIDGLVSLRTLQEVLGAENLIAEAKKVDNVRIINWHSLEG